MFNCKDCTERHVGCHAQCQKYKEQKKVHEEQRQKKYKESVNASFIGEAQYNSLKKGRFK